ncbi:MAG: hypothetical protein V3U80_05555 [Flavobacteriaceae bacterium]
MSVNENLKQSWEEIQEKLSHKFADGEKIEVDSIIYLIGVQELGKGYKKFKKDEKIALMHIAVCRILEPYGYYEFNYFDEDGWPHYNLVEDLPHLKGGEQTVLLKQAIVNYFTEKDFL